MSIYVLVSGDFTPLGGMDSANHALAKELALREGTEVHLVTHRAWPDLTALPNVIVHKVPKLLGSYLVSGPVLAGAGRYWAKRHTRLGARVLVNGGNCLWDDMNWVHYVHAAYTPQTNGGLFHRLKVRAGHAYCCHTERISLRNARLIVTNSKRTKRDVIDRLGVPADRVHAVYYGIDPDIYRPVTDTERAAARRRLGWPETRPIVAFIGALGHDRNKGFDVLFSAWESLCKDSAWDVDLVAAGGGAEVDLWRIRSTAAGLSDRLRMVGFIKQIPDVLAAADALVSPTHYDAYGLSVQEALCCGLPAFVTRSAGVAERYPGNLADLLLSDPPNTADLVQRLRRWRSDMSGYSARVAHFSATLRQRTWTDMAREIVDLLRVSPRSLRRIAT